MNKIKKVRERANRSMTLEEKEDERLKSLKLLEKVKNNHKEKHKKAVAIYDKNNTVFYISTSKVNNQEYINNLILRTKNRF